ncbi:MAG: anaerobic ribonucleoside-triphosphate reductase activating protein [Oscillospiraceae bacterium]|nr:anaerobic ribonucleoside-triphosphate reductase activating protein [Oscillospiraceae bacterium]
MNLAGFYDESIANGLGWRAVVFVSGCPHHCKGCHNPETHNFEYGSKFEESKEEILQKIKDNSILKGITISGGEPLCMENIKGVLDFIKEVKQVRPSFNVWCYTGYTMEDLLKREDLHTNNCLKEIDVLVDGRFVEEKKNSKLKFRGSENQRLIDVKAYHNEKIIKQLDI